MKGPPTTMAVLKTKARNALPGSAFALPKQRKFPIQDAAHAKNARARLEQVKGELSPADYASAKRRIEAAERKFGVKAAKARTSLRAGGRGLRMRIHPGGAIDVRHMNDGGEFECLLSPVDHEIVAVASDADETVVPRVWIQLACVGFFKGHPSGPFDLTPRIFEEIRRNFYAGGIPVPVDADHASEMDPTSGTIPVTGAPAQGWIHEVENRDMGGLWGCVEWLEPARTYIKEGKYRYISPAIRFNAKDKVSGQPIGARLSSAAITNKPFLSQLPRLVAAADRVATLTFQVRLMQPNETVNLSTYAYSSNEYMPKIRTALCMPAMASAAECSDAMDRLSDAYEAGGGAMHQGIDVPSYIGSMRDMLASPFHATVEDIFDAVRAMIEAAIEEHEAKMHPGQESGETEMNDTSGVLSADGETNMADQDVKKLEGEKAVLMSEKATLETDKSTLLSQNAALTLKLNEATTGSATLLSEVTTLRDWKKAREESDVTSRVEVAFETYKDQMKLSDVHKTAMKIVLLSDPATFESLYPKVRQSEQHLLRMVAGPDKKPAPVHSHGGATGDVRVNLSQLARTVASERKISIADAQLMVMGRIHHRQ